MLEILSKSKPWLTNLILINCVLGGSGGMRGKSLLNEKAIIILSLNQSECRKLLRSASSRIGFSRDIGIEESACKSSCRPLFLAIRRRSSKDLFSLCFLLERPLRRTPWDRRFLRIWKQKIMARKKTKTNFRWLLRTITSIKYVRYSFPENSVY